MYLKKEVCFIFVVAVGTLITYSGTGLVAGNIGTATVQQMADGTHPPPPPSPPLPSEPEDTRWTLADGTHPPPPTPWRAASVSLG
jgi:hypothetical protein